MMQTLLRRVVQSTSTRTTSASARCLATLSLRNPALQTTEQVLAQPDAQQVQQAAARFHQLNTIYQQLPVEPAQADAGVLTHDLDVGEYVRLQVASQRSERQPPWAFPSHLLPQPQYIPKGTKLTFTYKYKHQFDRKGVEPESNRACRMQLRASELNLAADEYKVLERILAPRLKADVITIVCRQRPTQRENEVLCLLQLDQSIALAKSIAAQLKSTEITPELIASVEAQLPEPPRIHRHPEDEIDSSAIRSRKEDVVDEYGDSLRESYGDDVFAEMLKAQESAEAAAASASASEDDVEDLQMSEEDLEATFFVVKDTVEQFKANNQTIPDHMYKLAQDMGILDANGELVPGLADAPKEGGKKNKKGGK